MKDSVEEKIIELQKRKKELADMFVENNSGGLSQMSKEDILSSQCKRRAPRLLI